MRYDLTVEVNGELLWIASESRSLARANTFKGVCKRNLQRFVSMFQFNYNHRDLNPMDRFTELLHTILYTPSVTSGRRALKNY